jgi:asparagine synthase (glutamine-hydrolysing)
LGNFVAITSSPDVIAVEKLYQRAIDAAKAIVGQRPNSTIRNAWSLADSFPRQNASACEIASDAGTGSWLAVVGSCFHQSGCNDPKYLLRQYLSYGAEQLSRSLEGFFAIIVGSCHFYVRQIAGAMAFSSSSLLLASLEEVTPDPLGCQEFLSMGVLYEDRTIYREIKKLPAASITRFWHGKQVEQKRYWEASRLLPESLTAEGATDGLWQALVSSARRIGDQFDSVVCDLTGGYDSRATVAAFHEAGKPFATVVSGPDDSADVNISRGLARILGLEHLHYPPAGKVTSADLNGSLELCDGEYDLVEYSSIARIHRNLSERFQLSINGSFGEVARGYWWELLFPHTGSRRKLDSHNLAVRRYAWNSSSDLFQPNLRIDLAEHMAAVIDRATAGLEGFPNTFQMDVAYLQMRMQRWQGRIASSTDRIWPCLSPFMFRSVLEVMLQAPYAARRRSLLIRRMLAQYQPAIANYPLEHGYPAVPATWKNLPRFSPLVSYYGNKIVQKMRSRLVTANLSLPANHHRLDLWQTDEIKARLNSSSMKVAAILDPSALAAFLQASQSREFTRDLEWQRLLSLEIALSSAGAKKLPPCASALC